ncbi:MAG: hypothetical protein R2763_01190 [Mycobacterium sp.]
MVDRGVVAKPAAAVAAVLALLDAGRSARAAAAETGLDPRTVGKIRDAAADPAPRLTAV